MDALSHRGVYIRPALKIPSGHSKLQLLSYALAVSLAVILVRVLWVFPAAYLPGWFFKGLRRRGSAGIVQLSGSGSGSSYHFHAHLVRLT